MKVNEESNSIIAVREYTENHNNHKITLETSGEPNSDKSAVFEAELTRYEFKAVCDFITTNFSNDGKK